MDKFIQFIISFFSKRERYFKLLFTLFICDWSCHRIVLPLAQTYLQYLTWRYAIIKGETPYVRGPYESEVGARSNNPLLPIDENTRQQLLEQADQLLFLSWIVVLIVVVVLGFWLGLSGKRRGEKGNNEDEGKKDGENHSPLDQFSIVPYLPLKIGKLYFSFTNASFFLILTLCFVLFVFHLVTKKGGGKSVPNASQSVLELIYDFVPNLVNEQIGGLSGNVKQQFFPCISVTFTFSLFRNPQGMIPYSFTVTSHFIVTLGLSFSLFIGITIVGFVKNGLHFLSFSLPAGVPLPLAPFLVLLELIPHCFRALSLGIRLFANMMAGHSLVKILSGFAWTMLCMNDLFYFIGSTGPFFIVLALTGLELGVAILQAYVFTILICIYLNDAINMH